MADEEHLTYRLHTPTDRDRTAASDGITPPHDDEDRSANVGGSSGSYSSSAGSNPSRSCSGVAAQPGHEGAFVQPASYLRPRGFSYPMAPVQPERAVDQEEQMGLVSSWNSRPPLSFLLLALCALRGWWGWCRT
jgi:hypothetical protein